MENLIFTYNWNLKLNCRSFSTCRIENPKKYVLNSEYRILLQQKGNKPPIDMGIAILKHNSPFYLFDVTTAMTLLDANLDREDFIKLVLKMYSNKGIDFNFKRMSFLVFQFITINNPEKNSAKSN